MPLVCSADRAVEEKAPIKDRQRKMKEFLNERMKKEKKKLSVWVEVGAGCAFSTSACPRISSAQLFH